MATLRVLLGRSCQQRVLPKVGLAHITTTDTHTHTHTHTHTSLSAVCSDRATQCRWHSRFFRRRRFTRSILPSISAPGFFNLTATFRQDSDIPTPYLQLEKLTPPQTTPPSHEIMAPKRKLMLWVVSNCDAVSRRQDYAAELRKYMEVDEFGACASRRVCWTDDDGHQEQGSSEECEKVRPEEYKFYFAAENSLCKDYFTG